MRARAVEDVDHVAVFAVRLVAARADARCPGQRPGAACGMGGTAQVMDRVSGCPVSKTKPRALVPKTTFWDAFACTRRSIGVALAWSHEPAAGPVEG